MGRSERWEEELLGEKKDIGLVARRGDYSGRVNGIK
jgi:hypothetical protein